MKNLLLVLIVMVGLPSMAQTELNDYKYVIVPKKFDAFKEPNQYQTSTLVKHLFSEIGFETAYEDELPMEVNTNRCMALTAHIVDGSNMFTTKAAIKLEDCQGKEVYTSQEGRSKEKNYKDSYNEAIRESFRSISSLNYKYSGKSKTNEPISVNMQNDVKTVAADNSQKPKNLNSAVEQEATLEQQRYKDNTPKPSNYTKPATNAEVVSQVATQEEQKYKDNTPKSSSINKSVSGAQIKNTRPSEGVLYAQGLDNGYQLVDSTPKIRLKIYRTSIPDYYLAESDTESGVVFENNGKWFFEYYENDQLVTESLEIKF
ncbi:hypothetical protein ACFSSG_07750 [Euzebyella marina]|nr:hypothetical protein [Euzebyella marina]